MMNKQNFNITRKGPTPEQLEYEELTKKMRLTTAKLRIAQDGVDVSSLSQQKLDMIIRTFDDMEQIQRDTQQKTSKIQQDANIQIQKINQDTGKKFVDIQKKYQDIIKSLKENYPQEIQEEQLAQEVIAETIVEDVREQTHEEKVAEITDMVLKAMRHSVNKKVDEILKTVETHAEVTIGKGVSTSPETIAELTGCAKEMAIESVIIEPGERPDKDIPTITLEMMKKTEEEIAKRREEESIK